MENIVLKADLHVHSKYSVRPSEWILQKLGCAESYTEPAELYKRAVEKGMDLVTISDHNTIDGSLEIAHLDNTFISEEITAYFPEDRCKVHILAWDINERHHEDISRCRENIFELVDYLNGQSITHALAHPTFSLNDRLTFERFEQLLLIFTVFEMNGTRDDYQNTALKIILERLNSKRIDELSNKYNIKPNGPEPWKKGIIGGSDDHSSLNIARTYTEVRGASDIDSFLNEVRSGNSIPKSCASTPKTFARNLYSIAYQFYKSKFDLERYSNDEMLLRFAEKTLTNNSGNESIYKKLRGYIGYQRPDYLYKSKGESFKDMILSEAREVIKKNQGMMNAVKNGEGNDDEIDRLWFDFVNGISEKLLKRSANSILENISGANLFDIFSTIGSAGSLYTMLAPYFLSYGIFTKDRKFCRDYLRHVKIEEKHSANCECKIAHFTDTFNEINGVARTLRMQVEVAKNHGKNLTMITCGTETGKESVVTFDPIGEFELPEYPEIKLYYPPILNMLDYCYEQNFTHIHSATPGPMGLAAMLISKILKIPHYSTYHTAFPQYAYKLTEDPAIGELMWKYIVWFYNQTDMVLVPSNSTGDELAEKGIVKDKIKFYPRGIDTKRFHPQKRNGFYQKNYQINDNTFKLIYVGRISREKNLGILTSVYKELIKKGGNYHLIFVGEGPFLDELKKDLMGYPVTFTGYLKGEDLSQAYASSDMFIFPSETDTFGNAVLEAQASGLPVFVTDIGGPKENMVPGETGFVFNTRDMENIVSEILRVSRDQKLMKIMRMNARAYVENRTFESAYLDNWELYKTPVQ
ncbi:MAG: glycosyltransferase [Desulfobacteraceae bacterium]